MITRAIRNALRVLRGRSHGKAAEVSAADAFLGQVSGVMHVGANTGQEREQYAHLGLDVVWVEPIPEVFQRLQANIRRYPQQRALQYLLTERDGQQYDFKVASNGGASSSILDIALHKDIWQEVHYVGSIPLVSSTLATMVGREGLDMGRYQALVLDTQGSELLVLQGAGELLSGFKYVKTEAADFEAYAGCCRIDDLGGYLARFGFREVLRTQFAQRQAGGRYFDVLYRRSPQVAATVG